jgi:hypothetical protein
MKPTTPLVSEVTSLRATEYSPDGQKVTVALTTRYVGERFYSVPVNCLSEFIADLDRLKPTGAASQAATAVKAQADTQPGADIGSSAPEQDAAPANPNEIKINVPKKWMIASALPQRPLVILVFDPQTKAQTGFGLGGQAAREMAAGLIKQADAIAEHAEKQSKS